MRGRGSDSAPDSHDILFGRHQRDGQGRALQFPLDKLRGHQLITAEAMKRLPAIGATDGQGLDVEVQVRLFAINGSNYTFYVTEFDGEDTLYGYVILHANEWGSTSLKEIAETSFGPGVPAIERDLYFEPKSLREALTEDGHDLP